MCFLLRHSIWFLLQTLPSAVIDYLLKEYQTIEQVKLVSFVVLLEAY